MEKLLDSLSRAASLTGERVLVGLPQVLEALVLLLVGWLLARLLRLATRQGVALLDGLIARTAGPGRWRLARFAGILATVVFWVVLLFFLTAATQTLGLQTFTDWLARLLDHLPTVAAGLLIMAVGYLLSGLAADLVQATASGLGAPQRLALARVAQGTTLVLALLVGADQIGLKVTWLATFAAVLLVAVLGGMALTISLGARTYVSNLIGAHHLGQSLRPGQRVRVAGHEGLLIEVTATSLVLETSEGRVLLPGRLYHDEAIVVLAPASAG
ncbi:MAG: small-conductance mechanosensitive channel [Hydrogenophaga sp.]|jgi:small-conductance mechanosensitive channel